MVIELCLAYRKGANTCCALHVEKGKTLFDLGRGFDRPMPKVRRGDHGVACTGMQPSMIPMYSTIKHESTLGARFPRLVGPPDEQ